MGHTARTYSGHYTVLEWEKWQDQWELIDGIPYCMSPAPTITYQNICGNIYSQLKEALEKCSKCKALLPVDWQVNEDTVVQPDVLVICEETKGERLNFPPSLIFEVLSPSTEKKDRIEKFSLYESERVKYYILINPKSTMPEVYKLENGKYKKQETSNHYSFDLDNCKVEFDFSIIW